MLADSLRPDHMGCYGYDKITTPFIDEKSKQALIFENAFTTGDWTRTIIPSLFTGLYVFQHKVIRFKTIKEDDDLGGAFDEGTLIYDPLPENMVTLAEALKEYGFKTFGLHPFFFVIDSVLGFAQGFDKYIQTDQTEFVKIFKQVFKENKGDNIFFYFHFESPHGPYINFYDVSEEFESLNMEKLKLYPYDEGIPPGYVASLDMYDNIGQCMLGYDKEIYWIDRQFKQLWEFLENEDALEDSLIILLSDHGEAFGEHFEMGHGKRLYDEIIHIPLVIWNFRYKNPKRIDKVVSIIDLYPTILKSVGYSMKHLNRGFKPCGRDIFKINKIPKDRGVIAEFPNKDEQENLLDLGLITYRTKDRKIYLSNNENNISFYKIIDGKEVRCKDSGEFKQEKQDFLNLLEKIKVSYFELQRPKQQTTVIDQERSERLRSLGYLQ